MKLDINENLLRHTIVDDKKWEYVSDIGGLLIHWSEIPNIQQIMWSYTDIWGMKHSGFCKAVSQTRRG